LLVVNHSVPSGAATTVRSRPYRPTNSGAGSANEPSAPTHRYAAAMPVSMELLDPEPHRDALFTAIKKEREQLRESRRRSYDELARILNTFDTSFPDAIPNDSDDFDERVHDYVALCRHIDERELPEAYERMMRLVTEQAPDAILTLHRVAEQEGVTLLSRRR